MASDNIRIDMSDNKNESLSNILSSCAEMFKPYSDMAGWAEDFFKQIKPFLETMSILSSTNKIAGIMAEHQFVLTEMIPQDTIERFNEDSIDDFLYEHFITDEQVNRTAKACCLESNIVFTQSLSAYNNDLFNLAITGFTAVLDRVLSEYCKDIKKTNLNKYYSAIVNKVKKRGDLYLDEIEISDYLIFITYPKALELFSRDSDFGAEEPHLLNRHWIMHGRTNKEYTKLDCVKILNMIYGTIRMGQLGVRDTSSND